MEQRLLLGIARDAIAVSLGVHTGSRSESDLPVALGEWLGNFVTLKQGGRLRGCIGSLEPDGPLAASVAANARRAAFKDPRFTALSEREFEGVTIELSVLSKAELLSVTDEAELCRCLRPGRDGLIIQLGEQRATFLPSVWAQLPAPQEFLQQLKQKACLPMEFWSDQIQCWRYEAQHCSEDG